VDPRRHGMIGKLREDLGDQPARLVGLAERKQQERPGGLNPGAAPHLAGLRLLLGRLENGEGGLVLMRGLELGDFEHLADDRLAAEFELLAAAAGTWLIDVDFAGHESRFLQRKASLAHKRKRPGMRSGHGARRRSGNPAANLSRSIRAGVGCLTNPNGRHVSCTVRRASPLPASQATAMAVLQILLAMVFRWLGTILNTLIGWASLLL